MIQTVRQCHYDNSFKMAANIYNKQAERVSTKKMPGRLLRRPLPPVLPRLPPEPPPSVDTVIKSPSPQHRIYDDVILHRDISPMRGKFSPPPPSEAVSTVRYLQSSVPKSERTHTHTNTYSSGSMPRSRGIPKGEMKWVLDPNYRQRTSLGTYVEGKSLVKPYRPRGPEGFPVRPAKVPGRIETLYLSEETGDNNEERYYDEPEFTLHDFIITLSEAENYPIHKVRDCMYSRHNYKKLQKLLAAERIDRNPELKTLNMEPSDDMPNVTPRVPQKQLLIEMASMVKEQMAGIMNVEMKSVIRPLPKYSPSFKPGTNPPHTEIVLYESDKNEQQKKLKQWQKESEVPSMTNIFSSNTARNFMGSRRSGSPFEAPSEEYISPTELAVLDSLMNGGLVLSLKAHFINQLPDIQPLACTVVYLNISFNDFRTFPMEVCHIHQLRVLKMRNNPIKEIPHEIGRITSLRHLVISFCLLSSLPLSLFNLRKLQVLDVSYNRISYVPNDIGKLRNLKGLNVEGNWLPALPCGVLKLHKLKFLQLRNNFMHPLFWKENSLRDPQRLSDIAAKKLNWQQISESRQDLPDGLHSIVESCSVCDCCQGPMFGEGIRIIRPVSMLAFVKNVPILFRSCSTGCEFFFKLNPAEVMEKIYADSS